MEGLVNKIFLLLDKEEYPDAVGGRWSVVVTGSIEQRMNL
jgi:hypothetical protein